MPTLAVTYGGDANDYSGFVFDNRYNVYDCDDYKLEEIGAETAALPDIPPYPVYEVWNTYFVPEDFLST